jgi:hypothetical protein
MDRREALRSLAAIAGATGINVSPVTMKDATDVALVILRTELKMSRAGQALLRAAWQEACAGTPLESVKAIVFEDGLDVEFVRGRT